MRFVSTSFQQSSSFYARTSGSESGSLISSSFFIATKTDLGGFDGDFTDGKVTFTVPSQSAGGSADVKVLIISASGNNPRVGIGVDRPLKAFDFKEVSDTNRGGEILIRGSRTTKGAEPNDEVGRINFIIDSSSYAKVETSGSAAEIIAFADEVDESGILGSLSFRVSAQKNEDSIERIRITPNGTKVTGSLTVSSLNPLFPSFTNIGRTLFSGSVDITSSLEVDGTSTFNGITTHNNDVVISNGLLDVNDDGVKIRGNAGLAIGSIIIPGEGQLRVNDFSMLLGGVHVGGISDPGTDNLLVDGTTTLVGTTIISGSTLNVPNLTAGAAGNYDKLLIVDSSGQVRTLADSLVPFIKVFDGEVPTNQTLVMFSGSSGNIANATGIIYNPAFGWSFSGVGSVYDIAVDDIIVLNSLTGVDGTFTGDLSADNGSFSGDLTVDGNITANQYIVSSSVTYMTQSFSSGSTIFGDTLDDTHQFTGSVDITGSLTVDGITYPTTDGDNGDVLITDGAGNLSFTRTTVYANVKNVHGSELVKGMPVHVTGSVGNTSEVVAASASNAATMPAHFILNETLADDAEGLAIAVGYINGVNTGDFDEGDTVYVAADGGYTNVKPTGSALIQNLGIVDKVDASNGSGFILGAGRSNDVPNLPVGKIWVGSSTYSVTSSVIHLDESNNRLGINTDNPTYQLHVSSSTAALGVYERAGGAALYLEGQETRGVMGTVGSHPLLIAYNSGEVARFTGTSFLVTGSLDVSTSITASGNISASGEIETNTISTITTVIASDSATNVDTFASSSYNGAIYDYILKDTGVGARAGQFMVAHDNGLITFTDNSTKHLSDSTAPEISAQINGVNVEVQVTNGNGYTFKSFVKKL